MDTSTTYSHSAWTRAGAAHGGLPQSRSICGGPVLHCLQRSIGMRVTWAKQTTADNTVQQQLLEELDAIVGDSDCSRFARCKKLFHLLLGLPMRPLHVEISRSIRELGQQRVIPIGVYQIFSHHY